MATDLSQICFIDCETTGLDPARHVPWEIAVSVDNREYLWGIALQEGELKQADSGALRVGNFYERGDVAMDYITDAGPQASEFHLDQMCVSPSDRQAFAWGLVQLIGKRHLAGMVPSFDERFIGDFCRRYVRPPVWHYHLIDIEPLVVGYLLARPEAHVAGLAADETTHMVAAPPWNSSDLSIAVGIDPKDFDRHNALGDVRWAKALYQAVMNTYG